MDKVVFTTLSSHPAIKKGEKYLFRKKCSCFFKRREIAGFFYPSWSNPEVAWGGGYEKGAVAGAMS